MKLNPILVENKYGTGAIRHSKLRKRIQRALRPKLHKLIGDAPFDWTKGYPLYPVVIKDQDGSFSCGGQAGSYWREVHDALLTGKYVPYSAKSLYSPIAYAGGGTTVPALQNQICNYGMNTEADVPSYQNGLPPNETFMEDTSWQTPILKYDALTRASLVPVSVKIEINSMAQAVSLYGGAITEIEGRNNKTWESAYPLPPASTDITVNNPIWRHFMFWGGASAPSNVPQIDSPNSWGKSVGDNGVQHFRQNYIDSGYVVDCFTFVPRSIISPTGSPIQWLLSLYQRFLTMFS